jgi:hypothetical protein
MTWLRNILISASNRRRGVNRPRQQPDMKDNMPNDIADLNFIKTFWRAELSCLHLACVAECNPMTTHCGRAAEVFEKHNARPSLTGRDSFIGS